MGRCAGFEPFAGTFNVTLVEDYLMEEATVCGGYALLPCKVSAGGDGVDGTLFRIVGEDLPPHFVEIIAKYHLRSLLHRNNWPSFPVEIQI